MNKRWEKAEIGDRIYAFEAMDAESQYMASLKVAEAFGGVCSAAVSLLGMETGKELGKADLAELAKGLDLSVIGDALATATSKINPEKIKAVTDMLMPHWFVTTKGSKDGHRVTYQDFSGGKFSDLYKVLAYSLRYYFSDFFVGLLSNGEDKQEAQDA